MHWVLLSLTAVLTYQVARLRKEQVAEMATLSDLQAALSSLSPGVDRANTNVGLVLTKLSDLNHDFQPELDLLNSALSTLNSASDSMEVALNPTP